MGVKLRMYNDAWRQECELFLRGRWSSSSDFDQRELARTQGANQLDGLLASPVVRSLWCGHLLVRWAVREEERRGGSGAGAGSRSGTGWCRCGTGTRSSFICIRPTRPLLPRSIEVCFPFVLLHSTISSVHTILGSIALDTTPASWTSTTRIGTKNEERLDSSIGAHASAQPLNQSHGRESQNCRNEPTPAPLQCSHHCP